MPTPKTLDDVLEFLGPRLYKNQNDDDEVVNVLSYRFGDGTIRINRRSLDPTTRAPQLVASTLQQVCTLYLDGRQRFNLASAASAGRLNGPPTSAWMAIERDPELFSEVDDMIHAAFEEHLVVQTFELPQLRPALAPEALSPEFRQSIANDAIAAQEAAVPLERLSDGVQVFCGLIAAVSALPDLLLLIDEPEAFLHPTLSRRLGADLARIARNRDARLIVATHSAEFLLGCLDEVPETAVLRLDYRRGVASSYAMPATEVASLSRDPLLRSSNSLQALFARSAVVCEADADRAFYNEINRRLQQSDGRSGALDTQFLNAQNWQTTVRIAGPLRAAGVPAAVVLDFETLASDTTWDALIRMTGESQEKIEALHLKRERAKNAIVALGPVAPGGPLKAKIEGLKAFESGADKEAVEAAILMLAEVGIFLVTVGELEGWLAQLGCTNKKTWVTDILQRLGSPGDPAYVEPGTGDVWEFMESVAAWLENPNRFGISSA